jgi:Protein of unknown function (DUF998)
MTMTAAHRKDPAGSRTGGTASPPGRDPPQAAGSSPVHAGPGVPARDRLGRLALAAGLAGPVVFYVVLLVLGQVTPGYDAMSRFGSELSIGRLGWIMTANFVFLGLAEIAFAAGLHRVIGPARSGRLAATMVGVAGAAFLVLGIFVTDLQGKVMTAHGAIHSGAALVLFFVAFPVAGLAFGKRFHRERGFARFSRMTAIAAPVLFIATFLSGDLLGLMQRILLGLVFIWLTMLAALACRLRRGAGQVRASDGEGRS